MKWLEIKKSDGTLRPLQVQVKFYGKEGGGEAKKTPVFLYVG